MESNAPLALVRTSRKVPSIVIERSESDYGVELFELHSGKLMTLWPGLWRTRGMVPNIVILRGVDDE
jgi:hypothetical protein